MINDKLEMIVEQQIIKKWNEELMFGQLYILQSKIRNIFLKEDI